MNPSLFNDAPSYDSTRFPEPREFQLSAHEKLREGVRNGNRRQLLVAPTGAGKTYLGLRIAHEALVKGRRALFVCDRIALINQTSARADEYGLSAHGVIQADHWRYEPEMPFQIASVQTLRARTWPAADVIIIDEAHTQYPTWKEYIKLTPAAVVGLTATPCSRGLGLLFTNMVNAATMHELTTQGVLVPMRILSCTKPDMSGATIGSDGEWTDKVASEREAQIIGDVVAEWAKYGEDRKTIAFGADIAYCEQLIQRFNSAGIHARTFTSRTAPSEREALLKEFTKPNSQIRILVSVEALAKGFDVQDIGCVIDARPLRKSLSTAIQMWGRGLRSSPNTGKTDCLLLDHSGNIQRFFREFEDIYHNGFSSLDMSEKLDSVARAEDEYEALGCPQCSHKPFHQRCMACGFQKPTRVLEDTSAGEMREIRLGKRVLASDHHDLWRQLTSYVRGSKSQKQQGYAANLFREITGDWPPRSWHIDSTEPAPLTRATVNELKRRRIAYAKAGEHASA